MIKRLTHIALFLFCYVTVSFSQELFTHIEKDEILIGTPVTLTYTIKVEKGDSILFRQEQNTLQGHKLSNSDRLSNENIEIEILDAFADTFMIKSDSSIWSGQYVITAWDEGKILIPGPIIIINDSSLYFDDITFQSNLTPEEDSVDLYDVKENFTEIPEPPLGYKIRKLIKQHWWWALPLIFGGIGYFILRRIKRRPKKKYPVPKPSISLKKRALLAIDALDEERMWEKDRLKEHFVELSYILRSYLSGRYGISLLDKTTCRFYRHMLRDPYFLINVIGIR